jgi:2'-5' RNA ligase
VSPAGADDAPRRDGDTAIGGGTLVGVVLPLPPDIAEPLHAVRCEHGLLPRDDGIDEHVTLLPPIMIEPDALHAAESHLTAVAASAAPFRLALAGVDTFRPVSPVVFLRLVGGMTECYRLQRAVRTGPLRADLAFAYHPHVTVAHTDDERLLDDAVRLFADVRAEFTVTSFDLHRRRPGRAWEVVRTFRLGSNMG